MEAPPILLHPTDKTLGDYGLGRLDETSSSTVHDHLKSCSACRERVAGLTSDTFLGRFRQGQQPTGRSIPGGSLVDGTISLLQSRAPSAPPPADTLPPGLADHPDYRIKRELGRGGMGVVYLAHNTMMGRDEVLKVIGRHILERPGGLERFQREIRAVAKLRHPNIVAAHAAFRIDGGLVFAMEYVEGLDLSKVVKTKGPLAVAHAAYFIHQAALGLQHAHERGMVHRDIKPHNLMLTHEGKARVVKVLDFGLAKATREEKVDGGLTSEGQALGTPDYIAPEQIINSPDLDIRADIYSLGGTLFYLLTGRPPFQADSLYDLYQAHMSRDIDPLNLIRPEVPAELAAIVAKMMAKDPRRRFQAPFEVAQALAPFFKRGAVASNASNRELSQGASPNTPRAMPAVAPTTTSHLAPKNPPTSVKPTPESDHPESILATMINFRETEPQLKLISAHIEITPQRRWLWPSVAACLLICSILAASVVVTRGGRSSVIRPNTVVEAKKHSINIDEIGDKFASIRKVTVIKGNWTIDNNELIQTSDPDYAKLSFGDANWSNYDMTMESNKMTDVGAGFQFIFHRLDDRNYGYFGLGTRNNRVKELGYCLNGDFAMKGNFGKYKWEGIGMQSNRWYLIKVKIRNSKITCYVDNELIFEETFPLLTHGRIGLVCYNTQARFRRLKVTDPEGKILFEGMPDIITGRIQSEDELARFNAILAAFSSGITFSTLDAGDYGIWMEKEYRGRQNILCTHPVSRVEPCILRGNVFIPPGKKSKLVLDVANHAVGDWRLVVKINDENLHLMDISSTITNDDWLNISVDLSRFAGSKIKVEILHEATGWYYEVGYWSKIAIVDSN